MTEHNHHKFPIAFKGRLKHGKLQKFIEEMGWTHAEFAEKLGTHGSTVGNWINLKKFPGAKLLKKVCQLVGETPNDLFPSFLNNPNFLKIDKTATLYKEVNTISLPDKKLKQIGYTQNLDENIEIDFDETLKMVLKTLPAREEMIIKKYFGIDCQKQTLLEIGKSAGVSRERIRQIVAKALRRLRHKSRAKLLKPFSL